MFFIYGVVSRPARFSGDRHHSSGDVMVLLCHMILLDHVTQSFDYHYGLKPLKISQSPAKFGGHRNCGSGELMLLVCTSSQDHVIKVSCDFTDRSLSR